MIMVIRERTDDQVITYVLVDGDYEEMSEECDSAQEARNLLTSQDWEPEVAATLRVVRKIYAFDNYEEVE